jgi:predicted CXXCH cytochrome family protein
MTEEDNMLRWIRSLGYGILFAVPLMIVTFAMAQAADAPQVQAPDVGDCSSCHEPLHTAWLEGSHGQALADPAFRNAWQAAGQPEACLQCHVTGYDAVNNTWTADGVTCEACHGKIAINHPLEPMKTDRTGKVCGDCHSETYFQWQVSSHGEHEMDCADCHDPHTTNLKAENEDELCAACHMERSTNFAHTKHSEQGLSCVDCHLSQSITTGEGGHSKRDHTFFVSLEACTNCHVGQMHDASGDVHTQDVVEEPAVDAMAAVEALPVSSEPVPVSPLGFTVLAGMVGIAFGIVVSPWIDRARKK